MFRIFGLLFCFYIAGCASSPGIVAVSAPDYVYKLGRSDKVKITVFGEEQLSGDFAVAGTGDISFPLLGPVKAAGRTLDELRFDIQERLGNEYVRNPRVVADIIRYRPVFILGEVQQPGEFAYSERMTIYALVAKAGGFTYRANQKSAFVRREESRVETQYALESATAVQPGDTVRIGQRLF